MMVGTSFLVAFLSLFSGTKRAHGLLALVIVLLFIHLGCSSKTVAPVTPPPPMPLAPSVSIAATPETVQPGGSVTVTWKTENATGVSIEPIGVVNASGSTTVTPEQSTTYHITARGPGGVQEADARVTVTAAAQVPQEDIQSFSEEQSNRLDVFFDMDEFSIRNDQFLTIQNDAAFLKKHPALRVIVEGHCDETGSTEYNLALGERRASEVRNALAKAGVEPNRLRAISFGKERPFCTEESEQCMRLNRRVHLAVDEMER
jgi:peptidoglycan-associated lipoprotein